MYLIKSFSPPGKKSLYYVAGSIFPLAITEKSINSFSLPSFTNLVDSTFALLYSSSLKNFFPSEGISHGANKTILFIQSSFFLL